MWSIARQCLFLHTNQDDAQVKKKNVESSRHQEKMANQANFPPDAAISKIMYKQIGDGAP